MAYWTGGRSHHHHHRETSRSHVSVFSALDAPQVELHVRDRWMVSSSSLIRSSISFSSGAFHSLCQHRSPLLSVGDWNETVPFRQGIWLDENTFPPEDAARCATVQEDLNGVFVAEELAYRTPGHYCSGPFAVTLTGGGQHRQ